MLQIYISYFSIFEKTFQIKDKNLTGSFPFFSLFSSLSVFYFVVVIVFFSDL